MSQGTMTGIKPILLVSVGCKEFKSKTNEELEKSYKEQKEKLIKDTEGQYLVLLAESKEFCYGLRFKVL